MTDLGLDLGADDVERLEARTEGWPAALYLAALRLRLGDDLDTVTSQMAARGEDLFGALTDEVLRSTPEHERRFILELAVLDRFNADLCARVVGDEATTRGAFRRLTPHVAAAQPAGPRPHVVPLSSPAPRCVLYARLMAEDPGRARQLHARAGAWFESEGGESELHEAMHHYLAAEAWDDAAELLTRHSVRFVQSGALGGRAREWLARFPETVVRADARLCYVSAVLAALDGDRDRRDAWVGEAERAGWEGPMPDGTASLHLATLCLAAMICFDDAGGALLSASEALDALPPGSPMRAAVLALSAWHAHLLGRSDQAQALAREALSGHIHLSSAGLPLVAYLPAAVLALTACERGEPDIAVALAAEAERARDAGPLRGAPHTLPVTCASARLATLRGDPADAVSRCRAGLELAREWRDSSLMVPAALLELSRAHAALGDHEAAARVARAGSARIAGARDAGALVGALASLEVSGATRSLRSVDGVEELSAREIEVLRGIAGDGSLREVADVLYISRNTIKSHTRALYAKLGVGNREEAVAAWSRTRSARPWRREQHMSLADCTVMVVEDHEFQRSTTMQILANLGAGGVLAAAHGEEALALCAVGPMPDVIVCDLDMPGMDGIEFLRRIAIQDGGTAIIIASGLDEDVLRAAEATARGYGLVVLGAIPKPLTARRLLAAVGLHQPAAKTGGVIDLGAQDPWVEALARQLVGVRLRPRVELATGRLGGLEARAHRLVDTDSGLVEIDAASDPVGPHGPVALAVTEHVVRIALAVQEQLGDQGDLIDVTVVLPAAALHQAELVDRLGELCAVTGVEPARVCIAVPDAIASGEALELLTRLRVHGFGLGFDGFGSASATLPELERLPLTEVKIAAVALARATASPNGAEAFNATVQRLNDRGLEIICDGCATLAEWVVAVQSGCRRAQGEHVGPPLAAEDVIRWLGSWQGVR